MALVVYCQHNAFQCTSLRGAAETVALASISWHPAKIWVHFLISLRVTFHAPPPPSPSPGLGMRQVALVGGLDSGDVKNKVITLKVTVDALVATAILRPRCLPTTPPPTLSILVGGRSLGALHCGHGRIQLSSLSRARVILLWDRNYLLEKTINIPACIGCVLYWCACPRV